MGKAFVMHLVVGARVGWERHGRESGPRAYVDDAGMNTLMIMRVVGLCLSFYEYYYFIS